MILSLFFSLLLNTQTHAQSVGMKASVKLSPAGSFTAETSDVIGHATKVGDGYQAKDIKVNLKKIRTGVELRDTHTQKHLETEKYPEAILVTASGKDGKGKATIKFHGEEKPVEGTYKILNNKFLQANFNIKLNEFKITGIRYMGAGVKDDVAVELIVPIK